MQKPARLYHGSTVRITGSLTPVLRQAGKEAIHTKAAVFATARIDLAAMFMFPQAVLCSFGFEQDIPSICAWGTPAEYTVNDRPGYLYVLPPAPFEKIGKDYEWQSFSAVAPSEVQEYASALQGLIQLGVQVYFINDDVLFDRVMGAPDARAALLCDLQSENQRLGISIKTFRH